MYLKKKAYDVLGSTKKAYKKQSKLYTNYKRILLMPKTRVFIIILTAWKKSKYGLFFWSVFYRIWTENSVFGHFSRSAEDSRMI